MKKIDYKFQMRSEKIKFLKKIGFTLDEIFIFQDEVAKLAKK